MLESEYEYLKYPYLINKDFWFSNILLKKDIEDIEEIINNKKKLAQAEKEKNKETLEYNYQFLIKAGDDRKTSSCVQNLKKLADSFFENYYDKLINNDLTCYEMLESKYKYLKYPYLIDNEGWLLDNFFNNNINGDVEYHEFKDDFLIATEECTNTKYRNKCFGQHKGKLLKQFEYAIKQPYHILSEQSKILGQLFLGKDKIDNSYKCEINDDNSLSVSLKLDNKLETYDVKFNSVKISLDCNNKELKVDWNGKYIYREVEKDVQITSVFDVSEWIK